MLLLQAISAAPDQVTPPSEVLAAGLQAIIAGLLTRDPATRLTLVQLRLHQWLTAADRAAARSERGALAAHARARAAWRLSRTRSVPPL